MNVIKAIYNIFKIGCCVGTLYMAIHFVQKYISNEDGSSIMVKRFRQGKIFPVISLCLRSKYTYDGLYNDNYTKDILGIDANDYKDVLLGKRSEANLSRIIEFYLEFTRNK